MQTIFVCLFLNANNFVFRIVDHCVSDRAPGLRPPWPATAIGRARYGPVRSGPRAVAAFWRAASRQCPRCRHQPIGDEGGPAMRAGRRRGRAGGLRRRAWSRGAKRPVKESVSHVALLV
jgi:hypothetical protein